MKGKRFYIAVVLVVTVVFLLQTGRIFAAPPTPPEEETISLEIGKLLTIDSKILGEKRPILVYIPDDYASSGPSYPVLYLLDGDSHFHHATGIVDFLSKLDRMPRMIVVGIPNIDRNRDFLPTRVDDFPPVAGADKFLAFIREELTPFMDKHYRTVPYRIICGHSYGGLFGIYSLVNSPGLFQAHIIISPSAYWDDFSMLKKTGELFKQTPGLKGFFYVTAAGADKDAIRFATKDFAGLLEKEAPKGFEWYYRFMEKEDHNSTFHRVFYNALETLYDQWRLSADQLSGMSLRDIREHYTKLSRKYGYEIPATKQALDLKEYLLRQEKKFEEAIDLLEFRVATYPNSAVAHYKLGYLYKAASKMDLAKTNFEKAVALGEQAKDPRLPMYKESLSLLLKKIK
ncbi:MAG: alpha/beta hydrolase-fold protein [Candidatus Aminicenantes bacterium]|nr:alpha/beta hydrolase-fold protein [Candidatus Aminicenantes bacterium]